MRARIGLGGKYQECRFSEIAGMWSLTPSAPQPQCKYSVLSLENSTDQRACSTFDRTECIAIGVLAKPIY